MHGMDDYEDGLDAANIAAAQGLSRQYLGRFASPSFLVGSKAENMEHLGVCWTGAWTMIAPLATVIWLIVIDTVGVSLSWDGRRELTMRIC